MSVALLPILLKTENLQFLIVGGKKQSLIHIESILRSNPKAKITVVDTKISRTLYKKKEGVNYIKRSFEETDLQNANLVIVASKDLALNTAIKEATTHKTTLISTPFYPHLSDFELKEMTSQESYKKEAKRYKRLVLEIAVLFMVFFIGYGLSKIISTDTLQELISVIPKEFYGMILIGFVAQLIDGAVGLGYGVTCATSMMLLGIKLPAISGSIHTAEMFSSAISGYSHYKFGNVNKKLLFWLAVPGVVGAICGSLFLIYLGNTYTQIAYVILAVYTMVIGIRLLIIAFRKITKKKKHKHMGTLGFIGGFLDAFGGGGWGPIVTSTLLAKGRKPSYVIGTVSLAEFFVTFAASVAFFIALGVSHWYIIVGLIIGGAIAAPIAAKLAGKLPQKLALLVVAALVIAFSIRIILKFF